MLGALIISVRFHEGRYHGAGDWPPSPARLFQALVAGVARGGSIVPDDVAALAWLERLDPPVIAAPPARRGQFFSHFMPNNDLDAKGGDPARIAEVRTASKRFHPYIFDPAAPFLYVWRFEDDAEKHADRIRDMANNLYQLGRGVDMAWAVGECPDADGVSARLAEHQGAIYRPALGGHGISLACPGRGSLDSLIERHAKSSTRFQYVIEPAPTKQNPEQTNVAGQTFTQPPKPRFRQVAYNSPPERRLYDLRDLSDKARFHAWPLREAARLVETARDTAAAKLRRAYEKADQQNRAAQVEPVFIGRGAGEADKAARVRIVPLPSIGHPHAESSIRRMLVEIPPDCPLPRTDVAWAFSGLHLGADPETGEIHDEAAPLLVEAEDSRMLRHYGIEQNEPVRVWRTVTPTALPEGAARRRIDPARMREEVKGGAERRAEEVHAATAVRQALRHAVIATPAADIRLQREPFRAKGARAETFAAGTRFSKHRLWHVEIAFADPICGPIIIGDGRYLGLGLMAPVKDAWRDLFVFPLPRDPRVAVTETEAFLHTVRRALMARARDGNGAVAKMFSGHEPDGAVPRSGSHEHIFLAADDTDGDGRIDRLIVAAPWICDRSGRAPRRSDREAFDRAVSSLVEVRAGKLGVVALAPAEASTRDDRILGLAQIWESRTPYHPTRHPGRNKDASDAVERDLLLECDRRGLPRPQAEVLELSIGPNGGRPIARLRLRFAVAVQGPILLGRDSHAGGGVFAATG